MADVNGILQFQMIGNGLQIVGIMIHVVATVGLCRATMSASIGRNDAETFVEEKKHLGVPIIGGEGPGMTEHNRLSASPIFIIDLDVLPVFFFSSDVGHDVSFS